MSSHKPWQFIPAPDEVVTVLQLINRSAGRPPPPSPPPPLPRSDMEAGELIGWRCWYVDRRLQPPWSFMPVTRLAPISTLIESPWPSGQPFTREAVIKDTDGANIRISDHNHAGIWAFKSKQHLFDNIGYDTRQALVWGTCWMWGTVIEHEVGYRSQFASVRSIEYAPDPILDLTNPVPTASVSYEHCPDGTVRIISDELVELRRAYGVK